MIVLAKTRAEAEGLGLRAYNTGLPCKHGHLSDRRVSNNACIACSVDRNAAWKKANPERHAASVAAWKKTNHVREAARMAAWYKANHEHHAASTAAWRKANYDKRSAMWARRKATKLNATPAWADHAAIGRLYEAAAMVGYHVDHKVPLQSPLVCGLHVEHNLQLLTPSENTSKGNRFNPENYFL